MSLRPINAGFRAFAGADWPEVHDRPLAAFVPVLEALRGAWDLGAGAWARLPGGEDCAAFALGDRVVKVVPPEERASVVKEAGMLPRVAGALPVPVPTLLDRHEEQGWTALLMSRIPGVPICALWATIDEPERERLLAALGEVAAALRRVPLLPSDPRPDLRTRASRRDPDVAAWIDRWLPPPAPEVFVHGDLTHENVLVEVRGGRPEISGIVDFAGAFAAEAPLELVSPGVMLAQGRPRRLAALARSAGIVEGPERRLAWHLLHPYARLPRDLEICGHSPNGGLSDAATIWR